MSYKLVPIRQMELKDILFEKPLRPPIFKVGDAVTFMNDAGMTWPGKIITGIELWVYHESAAWRYHYAPSDTPWFATGEDKLILE